MVDQMVSCRVMVLFGHKIPLSSGQGFLAALEMTLNVNITWMFPIGQPL